MQVPGVAALGSFAPAFGEVTRSGSIPDRGTAQKWANKSLVMKGRGVKALMLVALGNAAGKDK